LLGIVAMDQRTPHDEYIPVLLAPLPCHAAEISTVVVAPFRGLDVRLGFR
jgi:hypothetical protein